MPQMPQGIIKGGQDDLKLSSKELLRNQAYINGQWVDAKSGKKLEVINKATHAVIGHVPDMAGEETKVSRLNEGAMSLRDPLLTLTLPGSPAASRPSKQHTLPSRPGVPRRPRSVRISSMPSTPSSMPTPKTWPRSS